MPAKINYIGACKRMNNGQLATVIEYRNSKHMTVQFEDGTIVNDVYKVHFDAGKVSNPNYYRLSRISEVNRMSNGQLAKVVEYRSSSDIDVEFEDGTIVNNVRYDHFKSGAIANPSLHKYQARIDNASIVGVTKEMNCGLLATCIEYNGCYDLTVQFETGEIVYKRSKLDFLRGEIVSPSLPKYFANRRVDLTGISKIMNNGLKATVVEDNNGIITIQFADGYIVSNKTRSNFRNGSIAHPMKPLLVSLPQLYIYYWLKYYFRDSLCNYRPDWMKNIKTGRNLELDIYIPSKQIAVEYDGVGYHSEYNELSELKYSLINESRFIYKCFCFNERGTINHDNCSKLESFNLSYNCANRNTYKELLDEISIYLIKLLKYLGVDCYIKSDLVFKCNTFDYNYYINVLYKMLESM